MPASPRFAPETHRFADDGSIPNNPVLPLVVYRGAIDLTGTPNPAEVIETTFERNGWGDMWRNGIFHYVHYHSGIHEALGIARGRARVRFGGNSGVEVELNAGDVAILPAGTGHQGLSESRDLVVVGAYPPNGRYDLCRGSQAERARARALLTEVPMPPSDPVYGAAGPLCALWRA